MKAEYVFMNVIAPSFILLPIIVALFKYRLLPIEAKVFLSYMAFDTIVSIVSSTLAYNHLSNMPLFHVSTIIATIILLFFFSHLFFRKDFKKYIYLLIGVFPILGILNTVYLQNIYQFNSYTFSLQHIIVILLCFLYWGYYENILEKPWISFPLNWILAGLLLYFSSAFIIFTFSNFIVTTLSKNISILLWNIHAILTIIMYILISIGFSKYKK